ncbi:hypothetical protein ACI4B7_28385, partial [Klebsiella pneumoniae]|uniref:hypothetical protein n=1 Tax=Klebsiella pneumoniae TaxID=573 RepID=UPI00385369B7
VRDDDRVWIGPVPVTSPRRTLADCASSNVSPETFAKAMRDALRRGKVSRTDVAKLEGALGRGEGVL